MGFKSPIQEVERFLNTLQAVMGDPAFNVESDFILISKRKPPEEEYYSTPFTLLDLEFDVSDVVACIRSLSVGDYSETLFDKDNEQPPLLFVFGVNVKGKKVYIKVKVKQRLQAVVLCVSFHYARYRMNHPYR
ncbi:MULTISPECIES: type II toxin-antitoxin system MqsR family toxin [Gordonibacter]|uniref:Type II toxin-antitoxin system MqsR family toxin n=1 Tax=Gordonibacter faecis TaxID=3047475 RepID=A0ABT7DQ21_9ACTN|nr:MULTISPECIES: type II toxin-antitoxin system MqsR family toxin [unclassified Gordonibacter]MDJ1651317.1 type II toxin-antitoxin system MqsR family toxin [Gordonibacter sp. KGMB12511]HIW76278.1 type II toxin-antitoxin system MqsR family toxin [Candidatus Gordonibacter avicola]